MTKIVKQNKTLFLVKNEGELLTIPNEGLKDLLCLMNPVISEEYSCWVPGGGEVAMFKIGSTVIAAPRIPLIKLVNGMIPEVIAEDLTEMKTVSPAPLHLGRDVNQARDTNVELPLRKTHARKLSTILKGLTPSRAVI